MIDAKEKAMKKNIKTRLIPQLDGEGDDEGGVMHLSYGQYSTKL